MRRILAPCLALLAAGCAAGPDYRVPTTAIVNRPQATEPFLGASTPGVTQADLPPHWWRLYGDPRLDAYVAEALAANTDLRAADANLRRASAIVRESEAARTVTTGVSGQATAARLGGPTAALPAPFSYALGLDLNYPLDLAGGIRRGIEAADARGEAALAARDQTRVVVAAAVTRDYARVCADGMTLAAVTHVVAIQRQTLDLALRMARGGRGTRFDSDRARAAAFASEAAIPDILADRKAALFELAALMGRVPADYPRELEGCAAIPALAGPMPVGDALTASSFGFSFGPLVSWSFPNRKAVRARIAEAGADTDAALAGFDGSVLLALKQTESALSAYGQARDRLAALARAADAAGRANGDADKLQRFGRTPFLDVLNAQARYADAQTSLSAARATMVDRQIDVFLALGGGWE